MPSGTNLNFPNFGNLLSTLPAHNHHIYWFAYYDLRCPSVRYRGRYLLDALAEQYAISSTMVHPGYDRQTLWTFIRIYLKLLFFRPAGSWIVIQKIYTRGIYAKAMKWLVRLRPKDTVYDLDDAEYLRHTPETVDTFLRKCSCVIVGSQELAQYALQFNDHVQCIGSPILTQPLPPAPRNEILTLCWIGFYNNHRRSFEELVVPALEAIDFPLKVILLGVDRPQQRLDLASRFSHFPCIELDMPTDIDWQDEDSVYARIAASDLGLAPLLDTAFDRAKSAFKLKQCHAVGVPVLASPVGENVAVIQPGINGHFFSDPASLLQQIADFAQLSTAERQNLRLQAHQSAAQFGMVSYASKVQAFLLQMANKQPA